MGWDLVYQAIFRVTLIPGEVTQFNTSEQLINNCAMISCRLCGSFLSNRYTV